MAEKKSKDEHKNQKGPAEHTKKQAGGPDTGNEIKRLYRSTTNRMIAGICGGIGEFFNVDPTLIRILFAVSIFAGGVGIIAYIVGWIIIPEGKSDKTPAGTYTGTPVIGMIIGALLIFFGLSMLFDRIRYWYFIPDWLYPIFSIQTFFALVLIVIGALFIVFMFRKRGDDTAKEEGAGDTSHTLFRSRTDKKLAGVCGGIGGYFNIDSTIIRVLWVIITLMTGVVLMLILYILLAIVIPEQPLISEDV